MTIDLSKLALPFPHDDIEFRVSRAGMGGKGIYCRVLAYITARAIRGRTLKHRRLRREPVFLDHALMPIA